MATICAPASNNKPNKPFYLGKYKVLSYHGNEDGIDIAFKMRNNRPIPKKKQEAIRNVISRYLESEGFID